MNNEQLFFYSQSIVSMDTQCINVCIIICLSALPFPKIDKFKQSQFTHVVDYYTSTTAELFL